MESLTSLEYPDYEIILVDNGSTDGVAAGMQGRSGIRYLHYDDVPSSYAARNFGVLRSKGDVILFFDGDQTAPKRFLTELMNEYQHHDYHQIYPGQLIPDPRVPKAIRYTHPDERDRMRSDRKMTTACVAVPRKLFEELGGFNEQFKSFGDFEFFSRATAVAEVRPMPRIPCLHYESRNWRDHLLREERYAFGICVYAKHRGIPIPTPHQQARRLLVMTIKSALLALATPFRHAPAAWPLHWQVQVLQVLEQYFVLRGYRRYRLGEDHAGDLQAG